MFRIQKHNKVQVILTIDNLQGAMGWKKFIVGIIKIKSMPDQGAIITKDSYKGVLFSFNFWLPICDVRFK